MLSFDNIYEETCSGKIWTEIDCSNWRETKSATLDEDYDDDDDTDDDEIII